MTISKKKISKRTKTKVIRSQKASPPKKSSDVPATQGMLYELRGELKSDISGVRQEVKSVRVELKSVKADVKSLKTEVRSVKADVKSLKAEVRSVKEDVKSVRGEVRSLEYRMDAKFDKVISEIHRVGLIVEEQNARNKFALDGYTSVSARQDAMELEIGKIKKEVGLG